MNNKTEEFLGKLKSKGMYYDHIDYSLVDYINSISPVKLYCKKHNLLIEKRPSNLVRGEGQCTECSKEKKRGASNRKKSINDMILLAKERNGNCLSMEYVNAHTPLIWECEKGHKWEAKPNKIQQGTWCKVCSVERVAESNRGDLQLAIDLAYSKNGKCLSTEYKNARDPLEWECEFGHRWYASYGSVSGGKSGNGSWCSVCNVGNKRTIDQAIEYAIFKGGKCLSTQMSNSHERLEWECGNGHKFYSSWNNVYRQNSWCRICSYEERKMTKKEVLRRFKDAHGDRYDYSLIKPNGSTSHVDIICKIHGVFTQRVNIHYSGSNCPTCTQGWNTKRILEFVNDIRNEDVLKMDPVELNVLISQGKLPKAFEEIVFRLEGTSNNSLKSFKESLGLEDLTNTSEETKQEAEVRLEEFLNNNNRNTITSIIPKNGNAQNIDIHEIEEDRRSLPSISNEDILVLDKDIIANCDDEAVEFFIQYKLRKVWNEVINESRDPREIESLKGGANTSRLRDLFMEEFERVNSYSPPEGYSFKVNGKIASPNLMQKLTVNRVKQFKRYGNWSGTGAGKTISFIVASREVKSKLTVVLCLNSTLSQLKEDILEVYPDSLVHDFVAGSTYDRSKYNYVLLNYEKFQQGYSEEMFQDFNENNTVDFIVIDEIHNAKQRSKKEESKRRSVLMRFIGRSSEKNPNLYLLGMSATPVINELAEAKSLLQLITGKKYNDLNTRGTLTNALKVFTQLLMHGIRLIPNYDIRLSEKTGDNTPDLIINGDDLTDQLLDLKNNDYLGLEKILITPKLGGITSYLKPKTIIYTYYTDKGEIPFRIGEYLGGLGYSTGYYIGEQDTDEREKSKDAFVSGDIDVLIASRTIGTGVDGLQKVSNRMIIITLPWTDSEYTQLKGRIFRQGSNFSEVDIIIPEVRINLGDEEWSWDMQRRHLIKQKRTLADAAVDGVIPNNNLPTKSKMCSDSLKALLDWKNRINSGDIRLINREDLSFPLKPEIREYLRPSLGDFSELNRKWSVSKSENTQSRLRENREEWYYYHQLYREKRKDWIEIPFKVIAKKIHQRADWVVADMGCGENLLSKEIPNKVYGFDYVACESSVVECDISNVPLADSAVDVVVYSLSLMGSNHLDYLREGYRVLKPYGLMFICEPLKKVGEKLEQYENQLKEIGFNVTNIQKSHGKFIYIDCIKQ